MARDPVVRRGRLEVELQDGTVVPLLVDAGANGTMPIVVDPAADGDEGERECPPHDFTASWGSPVGQDVTEDQAVPVIYCTACGDIRPLRIPKDLKPEGDSHG